ncbi:MAG: hypothetical protein ACREKE_09820 [bacterium]
MLHLGVALGILGLAVVVFLAFLFCLEAPQIPLPLRPPSRPGLWCMAHRADRRFPFQHLFFRLTPADPSWATHRPDLFSHQDKEGRYYCTLGAGPREGKLFLEFNRHFDLGEPVSFEGALAPTDGGVRGDTDWENLRIEALLVAASAYEQGLGFTAWSRVSGGGYNCNSMIHELAARAEVFLPSFSRIVMLCPGVGKGLPPAAFRRDAETT